MAYPRDISIAEAIKRYRLPPNHRVHWSKEHKANVVRAVKDEAISFTEARRRYLLSHSEYREWERELGAEGEQV
jgi:transposase-like protein